MSEQNRQSHVPKKKDEKNKSFKKNTKTDAQLKGAKKKKPFFFNLCTCAVNNVYRQNKV